MRTGPLIYSVPAGLEGSLFGEGLVSAGVFESVDALDSDDVSETESFEAGLLPLLDNTEDDLLSVA